MASTDANVEYMKLISQFSLPSSSSQWEWLPFPILSQLLYLGCSLPFLPCTHTKNLIRSSAVPALLKFTYISIMAYGYISTCGSISSLKHTAFVPLPSIFLLCSSAHSSAQSTELPHLPVRTGLLVSLSPTQSRTLNLCHLKFTLQPETIFYLYIRQR